MENLNITFGISFTSFIAVNRYIDTRILKDSKLLLLLIYIALRVKRSDKSTADPFQSVQLNVGEFIIGRLSTIENIDITESEYKRCLKRLQEKNIVQVVRTTNKFTLCKWNTNEFLDLNLEFSFSQQNNQQNSSGLTTNNNSKNLDYIINSSKKNVLGNEEYSTVLNAYMKYKGIELRGEEIKDTGFVIKKMFDSQRTSQQIIEFMKWLKEHENCEEYPWVRFWTITTVQKKLPEFIAGKLKTDSWKNEYPQYK